MSESDALRSGDTFSMSEADEPVTEEHRAISKLSKVAPASEAPDYGNIAYELLLLQQRLASYEQLHKEEMDELRQELERLRQTFLLETTSHTRSKRAQE